MDFLGFNTIIIANDDYSEDAISETINRLKSYGFKNIIFALTQDVTLSTISEHLHKKNLILNRVKSIKPYGIFIDTLSSAFMSEAAVYEKQISRLQIRKTNYLPIELPVFTGQDWIDQSLNALLYKIKVKPLFMSFEKNIATYEETFIRHLINTRLSAFMIDINAFENPRTITFIKDIINSGRIIIPGMSNSLIHYANIEGKIKFFKDCIGEDLFSQMIYNSLKAPGIILGCSRR